ncbi:unnamed protein product [Didymodactylos carnosus]|uniref:Uncharacterized protein n=1 Tax=Didymodactylos carnosus TaxID=1234261 RepID=A0A814QSJ8_9BILA|nr:unnamed protein product [Didymodactylos carnosus]CAF1123071.1 unnamed protein product [Didymodactylos carnosus]CAF3603338.1 unnamed protein product [Didymodactylos carnosus]CAF3886464.1 unnamed protein product [Didymodactylos carnosus]
MTKGGSRQKKLGRLIFGGNRKHSPAKRSQTRAGDVVNSGSTNNQLNIHDWAIWRMQLNEHMISGLSEGKPDLKYMRHFLQTNPFYQKHSRDPSSGRVRLMFSIPHPKLRPELVEISNKSASIDNGDAIKPDTKKMNENNDFTESLNSIAVSHRSLKQPNSNGFNGNDDIRTHSSDAGTIETKLRKTVRTSYTGADRVHSTLQKAVKGGHVLEKIKAFEQAAAAAAEASHHSRILSVSSTINRAPSPKRGERWKSTPATLDQYTSSPINEQSHQIRTGLSGKGRYIASRTGGHKGRKGFSEHQHYHDDRRHIVATPNGKMKASVLQPADGDIILKRRTPSQKTIQDEDCSMTAISSLATGMPVSPSRTLSPTRVVSPTHRYNEKHWFKNGGHHTQQRRDAGSRSRHIQPEMGKKSLRAISNTDLSKQQNGGKSTSRRRWLRRKENVSETVHDSSGARQMKTPDAEISQKQIDLKKKQDIMSTKKKILNGKKDTTNDANSSVVVRKESTTQKKSALDNNRVYGVPSTNINTTLNEDEKQKEILPVDELAIEDIDQELTKNSDGEQQQIAVVNKKLKRRTITKSPVDINGNDDEHHKQMTAERVHKRLDKPSQKLSSTDGGILSQTSGMIEKRNSQQADKLTFDLNEEQSQDERSISIIDDVFIEDSAVTTAKQNEDRNLVCSRRNSQSITSTKITRHQSSIEEQKHYPVRRNISERSMKDHENVLNNENNQPRRSSIVANETNIISPNNDDSNINETKNNRRWYWSKETGGLKKAKTKNVSSSSKHQHQQTITIITKKNDAGKMINNTTNDEIYEPPNSEQTIDNTDHNQKLRQYHTVGSSTKPKTSKQILHAIVTMNSNETNTNETTTDKKPQQQQMNNETEFFENGPLLSPN